MKIYEDRKLFQTLNILLQDRIEKTVSITTHTAELEEKGVRLKLTAVDTPGFGDSINGQDRFGIYFKFLLIEYVNYLFIIQVGK